MQKVKLHNLIFATAYTGNIQSNWNTLVIR